MLIGIVALVVVLGAWLTVVSPERERASKVTAEVESARQQLATAESQADSATNARAEYSSAYASLVSLGQAVPASAETPALIYMLDRTSHSRDVQFSSITSGSTGASSASVSVTPVAQAGFTQQPFTFIFNGSFVDLYKLLNQLEGFTVQTPAGSLHVDGRLLTIDTVSLAPNTGEGQAGPGSKPKSGQLTGTITATAYILPAGESALGGATPSGPGTAGSTTGSSTPASGGGASGAPTAAVVKASP
jgi:Tfp pilus assembly protein PilO